MAERGAGLAHVVRGIVHVRPRIEHAHMHCDEDGQDWPLSFFIIVGLATSSVKEGLGRSSVLVDNRECCSEVEKPGKTAVEDALH